MCREKVVGRPDSLGGKDFEYHTEIFPSRRETADRRFGAEKWSLSEPGSQGASPVCAAHACWLWWGCDGGVRGGGECCPAAAWLGTEVGDTNLH